MPRPDVSGAVGKDSASLAEGREEGHCLGDLLVEERAGPVDAVDRDQRCLAPVGVLGDRLAGGGGLAGRVNEIVSELEGLADVFAEDGESYALVRGGSAEHCASLAGEADKRAGLHRLKPQDRRLVLRSAFGGDIEHLAAGHAAEPGCLSQSAGKLNPDVGRDGEVGEDLKGERQEGIAGKDRGRLVEGLVNGRPSAAEVVVVHRRQVVMDEAVAMEAFERRGGFDDGAAGLAEEAGAFDEKEGTEPLAAAERGVTHGGKEPWRPGDFAGLPFGRQEPVEDRFGRVGDGMKAGLEGLVHIVRLRRKRPAVKLQSIAPASACDYAGLMARRKKRERSAPPPDQRRGGLLHRLARVALVLVLIPIVLTPVYAVLAPISTLMIYERIVHGPIDRRWVPLDDIAQPLVASVVMSEDGRYCSHRGVDWAELNKVLDDLDGRPRGASTIAMQTVKNLYLWTSRSYVRKAFEIPLALYADAVLGKRRLMEIYLNIVEFGPGIFGAEAAARHYFGQSAASLDWSRSALLAASLPNPAVRNPASPGPRMQARAQTIAARARASGAYIDCLYR